jgi:hypothetical protein
MNRRRRRSSPTPTAPRPRRSQHPSVRDVFSAALPLPGVVDRYRRFRETRVVPWRVRVRHPWLFRGVMTLMLRQASAFPVAIRVRNCQHQPQRRRLRPQPCVHRQRVPLERSLFARRAVRRELPVVISAVARRDGSCTRVCLPTGRRDSPATIPQWDAPRPRCAAQDATRS